MVSEFRKAEAHLHPLNNKTHKQHVGFTLPDVDTMGSAEKTSRILLIKFIQKPVSKRKITATDSAQSLLAMESETWLCKANHLDGCGTTAMVKCTSLIDIMCLIHMLVRAFFNLGGETKSAIRPMSF